MSDDLTPDVEGAAAAGGMDRRTFVRRAAVTGALAWAAPSITSAPAAFAAAGGSPICVPVDPFSVEQALVAAAGTGQQCSSAAGLNILGGQRDVCITATGDPTEAAELDIKNGKAALDQPFDIASVVTITWDGGGDGDPAIVNPTGLGGEDFTADSEDRFLLAITIDQNVMVPVTISVWDGAGTDPDSITRNVAGAGPATPLLIEIPFSEFTATNFAAVGALQLKIDAPNAVDLVTAELRICRRND